MEPSITLPEALRGEYDDKSFCQKCHQPGHWTYKCPNESVYKPRPSRTQLLEESIRKARRRGASKRGEEGDKARREVEMPADPMPIEKIQIETDLLNYRMKFRKQLLKERKEKKKAEKLEAKKEDGKDESQLSSSSSSGSGSSSSSYSSSSSSSSSPSSSSSSSYSSSSGSSKSPSESSDDSSGSEHSGNNHHHHHSHHHHPQKKRVRHDSP